MRNVRLIDEKSCDTDHVSLGCIVKLEVVEKTKSKKDISEIEQYTIVGSTEADPLQKKISNESPVGKMVLGKAVGDEFDYDISENAKLKYKILEIMKPGMEA